MNVEIETGGRAIPILEIFVSFVLVLCSVDYEGYYGEPIDKICVVIYI
jgi:hypothetical protein